MGINFSPNYGYGWPGSYPAPTPTPMSNPVMPQIIHSEVIRVSGIAGASAYQMNANSEALLLDSTQPVIWFKTTDGAGYPTLTGYKPMTQEEMNALVTAPVKQIESVSEDNSKVILERLDKLERMIEHVSAATISSTEPKYAKSADNGSKQDKRNDRNV